MLCQLQIWPGRRGLEGDGVVTQEWLVGDRALHTSIKRGGRERQATTLTEADDADPLGVDVVPGAEVIASPQAIGISRAVVLSRRVVEAHRQLGHALRDLRVCDALSLAARIDGQQRDAFVVAQ